MTIRTTVFDLITARSPISAQSNNFLACRLQPVCFYLLYKGTCCWYSFESLRQEAIQRSTNNICFIRKIREKNKTKKNRISIIEYVPKGKCSLNATLALNIHTQITSVLAQKGVSNLLTHGFPSNYVRYLYEA